MRHFVRLYLLALAWLPFVCQAQTELKSVRVAFWNMENFFDPYVDSTRTYNAFTEEGEQHWTKSRYYRKRNNLYKALVALSENRPLGIMGVCEVENASVLAFLLVQTPLKQHHYRWVHYEGPDRRGIDPAIIYSLDHFILVESSVTPYINIDAPDYHSRDILYAKFVPAEVPEPVEGQTPIADTLHVFVNHWPSRYSGELETEDARACAAALLRAKVDSILTAAPEGVQPKIIIMGDMNDAPDAASVHDVLRARPLDEWEEGCLVNLMGDSGSLGFEGTLKYQGNWQTVDHIIVSDGLIGAKEGLRYREGSVRIFHPDFLLEDDATYHGKKPYRTYLGPRYIGGFSDHLPVQMELIRN